MGRWEEAILKFYYWDKFNGVASADSFILLLVYKLHLPSLHFVGFIAHASNFKAFLHRIAENSTIVFVIFHSSKNSFFTQNSPKHNTKWI